MEVVKSGNRLEILLDKQAITEVMHRYCRGLDRFDIELLRGVFWPDGQDFHGAFDGSASDFCAFVETNAGEGSPIKVTHHSLSNVLIELAGQTAYAESYFVAYHRIEGETAEDEFVGGRYVDVFEKRGDEWRIKIRRTIFDWARKDPATERLWDRWPAAYIFGTRNRQDPVYAR
jgi:hypothetical protein